MRTRKRYYKGDTSGVYDFLGGIWYWHKHAISLNEGGGRITFYWNREDKWGRIWVRGLGQKFFGNTAWMDLKQDRK
jgi:hypothetical protein